MTGQKFLSDVNTLQDLLRKKYPKLKSCMIETHHMHLKLLEVTVPKGTDYDLSSAKNILSETLSKVCKFEVHLEHIRSLNTSTIYVDPQTDDGNLQNISGRLIKAYSSAGFTCRKKFTPHVPIFQGTNLPVKDIVEYSESMQLMNSTEFVDKIELISSEAASKKSKYDHFKIEHTIELKEVFNGSEAYVLESIEAEGEASLKEVEEDD